MKNGYKKINLEDIPKDILFEGYYWYANKQYPEIIYHDQIQHQWFTDMPFVLEANFYAKTEQISIQIRHIDGNYKVAKIDLSQLNQIEHDVTTYIGHDLKGHNYKMIEAWVLKSDPLLENMQTLIPAWSAFAGFSTK